MVAVQIDVLAGSPCIATKNGRIAAEKDFEKAFITLPKLIEQETHLYVSAIDVRCTVSVQPPLDVLTDRARYFVRVEYPKDATLNSDELKRRLDALVRTAWPPRRDQLSEPRLVSGSIPEDAALAASRKSASGPADNASDSGVGMPVPEPSQAVVRPDDACRQPSLNSRHAGGASSVDTESKAALSSSGNEKNADSENPKHVEKFTKEEGEAEATTPAPETDGIGAGAPQEGAVLDVEEVDNSRSTQASASCAREEKRPAPFDLEQQVHPPESLFCTKSDRVVVIETDNASLPSIVFETNGEEPLLTKGECLPAGLALEVMKRPIKWIHVVGVAD